MGTLCLMKIIAFVCYLLWFCFRSNAAFIECPEEFMPLYISKVLFCLIHDHSFYGLFVCCASCLELH